MALTLRIKMILLLVMVVAVAFYGLQIITQIEQQRMTDLYEESLVEKISLVDRLIDVRSKDIEIIAHYEYSLWDGMADFISEPDSEFAELNIDWLLSTYGYSSVWVYDLNFSPVYRIGTGELSPELPISTENMQELFTSSKTIHFFVRKDTTITEIFGATVHNTDDNLRERSYYGYILIARDLDSGYIAEMEHLTGSRLKVLLPGQPLSSEDTPDFLSFTRSLSGWDGESAGSLYVSIESSLLKGFIESSGKLSMVAVVIQAILIVVFFIFFSVLVIVPLHQVENYLESRDESFVARLLKSQNEFGRIARLMRTFFVQKQQLESEIAEREKATEILRQFEFIVDATDDLMFLIDTQYKYRTVNKSFCDYFCPGQKLCMGKDASSNWSRENFEEKIKPAIASCFNGQEYETELTTESDGKETLWEARFFPYNEHGEINYVVGVLRDVTSEMNAVRALRESEQQFRSLYENANVGIYRMNTEGAFIIINPAMLRMLGYNSFQMPGHDELRREVFTSVEETTEFVQVLKEKKSVTEYETVWKRKDEKTIIVRENSSVFFADKAGGETYIEGILEDITERKQVANALQILNEKLEERVTERTAELHASLEQAPYAIAFFNRDGKLISCNNQFESFFTNLEEVDKDKDTCLDFLFDKRPDYRIEVERIFRDGGSFVSEDLYFKSAEIPFDGVMAGRWLQFRFYAVREKSGQVLRVVTHIDDVSQLKSAENVNQKIEEQRIVSAAMIRALEEERKRIALELHDSVGQKLMAARLNVDLLTRERGRDENTECIERQIIDAGKELRNIVYALHPYELERHGLKKALQLLCNEVQANTKLEINLSVLGIEKSFGNLTDLAIYRITQEALNNVVKHAEASFASVQCHKREDIISLTIEDNGAGLQVDDINKRPKSGSFGLRNIIERVEIMGGICHIESAPEKGTELHIQLPMKEKDADKSTDD